MLCLSGFERYSRWVPLRYNEVSLYGGSFPYFLHLKSRSYFQENKAEGTEVKHHHLNTRQTIISSGSVRF